MAAGLSAVFPAGSALPLAPLLGRAPLAPGGAGPAGRSGCASAAAPGGSQGCGALLDEGDDLALLLGDVEEAVAGALAPDGHVFEDAWVVADDFQPVPGGEAEHLSRREEDGQRAEGAGHVELVDDGRGHGTLLVTGSVGELHRWAPRDGCSSVE